MDGAMSQPKTVTAPTPPEFADFVTDEAKVLEHIWRERDISTRDVSKCAAIVAPVAHSYSDWQCTFKNGHGIGGLFCKRHARIYS